MYLHMHVYVSAYAPACLLVCMPAGMWCRHTCAT